MGAGSDRERDGVARLIVVEDDPLLCAEVADLFSRREEFRVVGAYADAAEARAGTAPFDLGIIDLGLPDDSGVDLIRELKLRWPDAELMAHTVYEDRQTVFDAIVAGASGYVLKGTGGDDLVAAARTLFAGGAPMSPQIARSVVEAFRKQGEVADRHALSAREREVLGFMEAGLSYKEAASRLHVSYHTVHTHIKRIYEKLHARTKSEAIVKARLRGLL